MGVEIAAVSILKYPQGEFWFFFLIFQREKTGAQSCMNIQAELWQEEENSLKKVLGKKKS